MYYFPIRAGPRKPSQFITNIL